MSFSNMVRNGGMTAAQKGLLQQLVCLHQPDEVSIDLQIRPICTVPLECCFLLWPSNNCSHNFTVLPSYVLLLWLVVTVEMLLQVELMIVALWPNGKGLKTLSNNLHCVVSGKKEGSKLKTIVLRAWVLLRINQSNSRRANEYLWPPVGSWKPTNRCSKNEFTY